MKLPIPIWALLLAAATLACVDACLTRQRLAALGTEHAICLDALDTQAQEHAWQMEAAPSESPIDL